MMNPSDNPAKVFAGFKADTRPTVRRVQTDDGSEGRVFITNVDRQIQVTGVGEISVPPDRFSLTIRISSKKDNVQDAKNSVTRRLDYVKQTLSNHNVQEAEQQEYKHMQRVESMVHLDVEICAQFADLQRCQAVANLLVEKLDSSVSISLPECSHSKNSLQTARTQASKPCRRERTMVALYSCIWIFVESQSFVQASKFIHVLLAVAKQLSRSLITPPRKKCSLLAIHYAKEKAREMARFVHLVVGRTISISETETKEWEKSQADEAVDPDHFLPMQGKMEGATVYMRSQVTLSFELKSKGKVKTDA